MIIFESIRWKNLLSTGNQWIEIDLQSEKSTLIVGNNGSGKTSILESIHLLGFGRSFRTHKNQDLVQKQKESLMVLAVGATSNDIQKKFGIRKTVFWYLYRKIQHL